MNRVVNEKYYTRVIDSNVTDATFQRPYSRVSINDTPKSRANMTNHRVSIEWENDGGSSTFAHWDIKPVELIAFKSEAQKSICMTHC